MPRRRKADTPEPATTAPTELPPDLSIQQFGRYLLDDPDVRKQMLEKARKGELPPAIIMRLWDASHGKPSGQQRDEDARMFTDEELDAQIERLTRKYQTATVRVDEDERDEDPLREWEERDRHGPGERDGEA